MEKIIKTLFNSYALTGFFAVFGYWLFFKKEEKDKESNNPTVNDIINLLDTAFNSVGTFDWDTDIVVSTFNKMSATEIKILYRDFGYRMYNKLTRKYQAIKLFGDYGVSHKLNLQSILQEELGSKQLIELKNIHIEKGLEFPYLA